MANFQQPPLWRPLFTSQRDQEVKTDLSRNSYLQKFSVMLLAQDCHYTCSVTCRLFSTCCLLLVLELKIMKPVNGFPDLAENSWD